MKYKLAIFDMDGTILDTVEDLKDSVNHALGLYGLPPVTRKQAENNLGNGSVVLCRKSAGPGISDELNEKIHSEFKRYYNEHSADKTCPYEGIIGLLNELRARGVITAVVSNKPDEFVQELCKQYFGGLFDIALGEKPSIEKKPAKDMVYYVLDRLDISPEDSVYIGDTEVDILTAKNSGLDCLCVAWGFRPVEFLKENGAKIIADSPEELLNYITG